MRCWLIFDEVLDCSGPTRRRGIDLSCSVESTKKYGADNRGKMKADWSVPITGQSHVREHQEKAEREEGAAHMRHGKTACKTKIDAACREERGAAPLVGQNRITLLIDLWPLHHLRAACLPECAPDSQRGRESCCSRRVHRSLIRR